MAFLSRYSTLADQTSYIVWVTILENCQYKN
jgi:hypothetical protein